MRLPVVGGVSLHDSNVAGRAPDVREYRFASIVGQQFGALGDPNPLQVNMAKEPKQRTYEEAVQWLRDHGFDILEAPGTQNRVFLKKYNSSAAIEKTGVDGVRLFAKPGYLVGSEISRLIDKGYQKFLKTTKTEIPATADHLKARHQFSEALREALGPA